MLSVGNLKNEKFPSFRDTGGNSWECRFLSNCLILYYYFCICFLFFVNIMGYEG